MDQLKTQRLLHMNENFSISELESVFNKKLTENGDDSFVSTGNHLTDILFQTEYYTKHLNKVTDQNIGTTHYEKLFSMFIRDPRLGLGCRDLGRRLMQLTGCGPSMIVKAGRWDDVYHVLPLERAAKAFREAIESGNELAKKWAPRYSSKNLLMARQFARLFHMNKQEYGKFIKCNTTERKLTEHRTEDIQFEHVPSLALIKYWNRFNSGKDTGERFKKYLESVKKGTAKMNVSTTNVYDIYRNRNKIDADLIYSQLEKTSGSWLPIIDVSGSMTRDDALGKALSIGKYLADTSTYCPNSFVTFSGNPKLVKLPDTSYADQIRLIEKSDWGMNTDLGAVMDILANLKNDFPEYIVILSDMEFDHGSSVKKDTLMKHWKDNGIETKIIWWNFNGRNKTAPETDNCGNIFMSGYNPMLLKYLETGFDSNKFIDKLLKEYLKNLMK